MMKICTFSPSLQRKPLPPPSLRQVDPFQYHHQVWHRHRGGSIRPAMPGNNECSSFQALVIQTVPAPIPEQHLDPVPATVQKHKQVPGQRVLAHHRAHLCRQAVETLAHISRLKAHKHLHRRGQREHLLPARMQWREQAYHLPQDGHIKRQRCGNPSPVRKGKVKTLCRYWSKRQFEKRHCSRRCCGMGEKPLPPVEKRVLGYLVLPAVCRDGKTTRRLSYQMFLNLFLRSESHSNPPLRSRISVTRSALKRWVHGTDTILSLQVWRIRKQQLEFQQRWNDLH